MQQIIYFFQKFKYFLFFLFLECIALTLTFNNLNLDYQDHVTVDNTLLRPTDLKIGRANPEKAHRDLGWKANFMLEDVIEQMIDFELKNSN